MHHLLLLSYATIKHLHQGDAHQLQVVVICGNGGKAGLKLALSVSSMLCFSLEENRSTGGKRITAVSSQWYIDFLLHYFLYVWTISSLNILNIKKKKEKQTPRIPILHGLTQTPWRLLKHILLVFLWDHIVV